MHWGFAFRAFDAMGLECKELDMPVCVPLLYETLLLGIKELRKPEMEALQ